MTATMELPKVDPFQDQEMPEEQFGQLNRLAAVGQMLASVSHETVSKTAESELPALAYVATYPAALMLVVLLV